MRDAVHQRVSHGNGRQRSFGALWEDTVLCQHLAEDLQ